jgi:hypothetical protein
MSCSCLAPVREYVRERDANFHDNRYQDVYVFNWAEEVGGALLYPTEWFFTAYYRAANSCCPFLTKTALLVACVFTTIIGLVGLLFKELGQWANRNGSVRSEAVALCKKLHRTKNSSEEGAWGKIGDAISPVAQIYREKLMRTNPSLTADKIRSLVNDFVMVGRGFLLGEPGEIDRNKETFNQLAEDDPALMAAVQEFYSVAEQINNEVAERKRDESRYLAILEGVRGVH